MKKVITILVVLVMVLSLVACSSSKPAASPSTAASTAASANKTADATAAKASPVAGGTLNVGTTAPIPTDYTWNKIRGIMEVAFADLWGYETLMRYSATGKPECYLLKSAVPDAASKTWTLTVKDGITFSDGSKLDADAVAWNLNYYKANGILASSFFANFDKAEVKDEKTVVCHFTNFEILFDYYLSRSVLIASKAAFDKNGAEWLAKNPVGTGPFTFKSVTPSVEINVVKNPNYWQGKVLLDGVHIIYYGEELVEMAALKSGDILAMMSDNYASIDQLKKSAVDTTATQVALPSYAYTLCFNSKDTSDPCNKADVRKAISYAIDTATLLKTVTYGYGVSSTQWCTPQSDYYNKDVKAQPYSVDTAKKMLSDAGYANGFSTKIWFVNTPQMSSTAAAISEMLAKVNIKAELNPIEPASYANYIGGWPSGMLIHTMGMEGGAAAQYATTFVNGITAGLGVKAFAVSDDLDALVKQAKTASTSDQAVTLFKQVAQKVFDDQCLVKVLYCTTGYSFVRSTMHDGDFSTTQNRRCDIWNTWITK